MRILFRNLLFRTLVQFWWIPVLAALVLGLSSGRPALGWGGLAAYLGVLAGSLAVGWGGIRAAVAREQRRHRQAEHRFLCPACLHTDEFRYACPHCEKPIEAGAALGSHLLGTICPACAQPWSNASQGTAGLRSYCSRCRTTGELELLHERAAQVRGALTAADFATLGACGGEAERVVAGVRCLRHDDGKTTTWTLCLEDLTRDQDVLPASHALHGLTRIWISDGDPLRLGQIIDHLVSRAELSDAQLAGLSVSVAAAQMDPAAQRLLSTRFGAVDYGISAHRFMGVPELSGSGPSVVTPVASEAQDPATLGVGAGRQGEAR